MSNTKILSKKLKAIVFTDIVNFSQLSAMDEERALEFIDMQIQILKPIVRKYNGDWLKEIGDGLLFSFNSSIDAVQCSIEIQRKLKNITEFKIRIGIHQGDIFIKNNDIFGDDVNIASRVESFAPSGGISISDKVYNDISGVKEIKTSFIGHRKLKGITQETKVRCITSYDLPKHKVTKLTYVAGYVSYFYGVLALISIPIYSFINYYIFIGSFIQFIQSALLMLTFSVCCFVVGHSCLSYYKGVSVLSQRLVVAFAYYLALFPIVYRFLDWVIYPEAWERVKQMNKEDPTTSLFILGFPFLIVLLIMLYNTRKER